MKENWEQNEKISTENGEVDTIDKKDNNKYRTSR